MLFDSFEPRQLLSADVLPVIGQISAPGEVDRYIFALAEPRRLYVDQQLLSPRISWSLTERGSEGLGPLASGSLGETSLPLRDGTGFVTGASESLAPVFGGEGELLQSSVLTLLAGQYELRVEGVGDATGDYRFRLIDIDSAPLLPTDEPVRVSFLTGGETEIFRFAVAEAGARLWLDLGGPWLGESAPKLALLTPQGTVFGSTLPRDLLIDRSMPLPAEALTIPGTYFLAVDGGARTPAGSERFLTLRQRPAGVPLAPDEVFSLRLDSGEERRFLLPASGEAAMVLDLLDLPEQLAGVIVSGDLSQRLRGPTQTGEVLFEVAPLAELRAALAIAERDLRLLAPGQTGQLRLAGLPGIALPVTLERIAPMARPEPDGPRFRGEARLEAPPELRLRPGMEGLAKIEAGEAPIAYVWSRTLIDWGRHQLWRLLP